MDLSTILAFISALFGVALALTFAYFERRSLPHWFFVAGLAALSIEGIFAGLAADADFPEQIVYWQTWRLVLLSCLPGIWLAFSLSYARGNYREFLRKWQFPLAAALLAPVALATLYREKLIVSVGQREATGHWIVGLGTPGIILNLCFLLGAVLVLMNLERTFRASIGTMRWRIKFTIIGLGVLFAVRAYTSSQTLLFRGIDLSLVAVNSGALIVACVLILRSLSRAGDADVTVYPSQAVLHTSFTVLLAGSYLLIVGVFAKVVTYLGGDAAFQFKAFLVLVSLVLLAILLLSDRVRLQTKRFVSRHFQRPQYDYRKVWRAFTEGTTLRVQELDLCRAVVKLVSDLFQVLSVTIWLVDSKKESFAFATSTSLAESKGKEFATQDAARELIRALQNNPDPIDIDASQEKWAATLRQGQPIEFREGGHRVCLPLIAGGELLGIMILGDRVGAVPFSTQDFDLLKCVGDQAAASLLNMQLSQRLLQAREMEAFQTMSAFFVHDLKNTASTLSLMLQNLPAHFNDPAFREDALRGVGRSVDHINDLIRRLSLLRQGAGSGLIESDLNELVADAVGSLEQAHEAGGRSKLRMQMVKELRPLPKQLLDPDQIQKVVTNLVLNANEAANGGGEIRIETSRKDNWTVLSVADNGCGMTRDFIQHSLFRPFQTTKKQGIGIGMFQSKTIVEAHHGRIEVQSEPGKGTTFRVFLPL